MLRKIRLTFAMICFVLITLLFLDFTGTLHGWFGWLAKIQFLPAVLYNPQIQISAESGTKRSIFRQKNKTKRSKNRLHTTLIKPEQKVNEDLCSGFVLS